MTSTPRSGDPAAPCCGRARRVAGPALGALLPGLALAVVPKCPLCIAAYLSVLGVSAGVAVPLGRAAQPLGLALAALAVAAIAARLLSASRGRTRPPDRARSRSGCP